jgi:glycine oxidase
MSLFPAVSEELRNATGIDNGFRICGAFEILEAAEAAIGVQWERDGVRFEKTSPSALRAHAPAIDPGGLPAYYLPDAAQVRNPRHVRALLTACTLRGIALRAGCPVLGFERSGERVAGVVTPAAVLRAGQYLLCAGAWSDGLLGPLGVRLGIKPVRGQIALLHTGTPKLRHLIEQGHRYLVPRDDGRVLVGSTEEDAGFVKATTATAIRELLAFAIERVPALGQARLERAWAGLRPGSPDGLAFLGRVPGCANLFVASGHYRAGIQLSPGTAQVMTELLLGQTASVDLNGFRVDRSREA